MRMFPGCVLPILVAVALPLTACDEPVPDGVVDGTCDDLSLGSEAAFDASVGEIFDTYCTLCHAEDRPVDGDGGRRGAVPGVDYDTYENTIFVPSTTWRRMADRTMPPMGRMPSTAELETVLEFLNCAMAIRQGDDDDSAQGDDDDSAL